MNWICKALMRYRRDGSGPIAEALSDDPAKRTHELALVSRAMRIDVSTFLPNQMRSNAEKTLNRTQQTADRKTQVQFLKIMFSKLSNRASISSFSDIDVVMQLAESPEIIAIVDGLLSDVPETADFGPFEELEARRESTGLVRRRKTPF